MNRLTYGIVFITLLSSCVNGPSDLKTMEGQSLSAAVRILGEKNYRVTRPDNFEPNIEDCGDLQMAGLINLRDPAHYIKLRIDRNCTVTSASSINRNVP